MKILIRNEQFDFTFFQFREQFFVVFIEENICENASWFIIGYRKQMWQSKLLSDSLGIQKCYVLCFKMLQNRSTWTHIWQCVTVWDQ